MSLLVPADDKNVSAHLNEEATGRDHEQAQRYVATVRRASKVRATENSHPSVDAAAITKNSDLCVDGVAVNEEGERPMGDVDQAEEGGISAQDVTLGNNETSTDTVALEIEMELTDAMVGDIGSFAKWYARLLNSIGHNAFADSDRWTMHCVNLQIDGDNEVGLIPHPAKNVHECN
ncbi:hypothetical protein PHMEG_00025901, partial [Phytophthora megakarya]